MFFTYNKKMAYFIILAIFFISVDRILKIIALQYFRNSGFNLLGDFFKFKFKENYNVAFSLPLSGWLLYILLFFIVTVIIYMLIKEIIKKQYIAAGCLTILLFGATSNILDRIQYGFVIDYLDLKYFTVFNVADAMIVGATILLIIKNIIYKKETINE